MNESKMQAVLMRWAMEEKKHQLVIPNNTILYSWEADLISVTKTWLVHEFEVKVSRADFLKDKKKRHKHYSLEMGKSFSHTPNYFWYAVSGFKVELHEVPSYAGLMRVEKNEHPTYFSYTMKVEKPAPRIHTGKLREKYRIDAGRWLSYKLKNMYHTHFLQE